MDRMKVAIDAPPAGPRLVSESLQGQFATSMFASSWSAPERTPAVRDAQPLFGRVVDADARRHALGSARSLKMPGNDGQNAFNSDLIRNDAITAGAEKSRKH
jgi:hypothetical protein